MKLKKLKEERAGLYAKIDELRKASDGRQMTAEERTNWNQLLKDFEAKEEEVQAEERYLKVAASQAEELNRNPEQADAQQRSREAFVKYLREGRSALSTEERMLIEPRAGLDGVSGTVLIPTSLATAIEVALKSSGGLMNVATVIRTATGNPFSMPTVNDTNNKAVIIGEYQQSSKGKVEFGMVPVKAFTYRSPIVPVSLELLQDSAFDIDTLVGRLIGEAMFRGMNEHFVVGTGVNQPSGLVKGATAYEVDSAAIVADDLLDLMATVNAAYQSQAKFLFNNKTFYSLLKLKDGDGQYIWQPNLSSLGGPTLFSKNYVIDPDMPDVAAGQASVCFGDLSKYMIRMAKDFQSLRLNEMLAEWLCVGIYGYARADGVLLDAGTHPVAKLVHKAI